MSSRLGSNEPCLHRRHGMHLKAAAALALPPSAPAKGVAPISFPCLLKTGSCVLTKLAGRKANRGIL
eukprot:2614843-Pleurochrysis_carterae.AAC.1